MDPHSPWPNLCHDILHYEIENRLDSYIDRLSLRAVCQSWRSLLPPPFRKPPIRLPFPMGHSNYLNSTRRGYFNLVHSTVYCLQPLKNTNTSMMTTKCWLIRVEETEEPGKVRLTDPLSLPADSETLSPCLPKRLNLLDHRVSEITKIYDLQFVGNKKINEIDYPERSSIRAEKVAVSSEGPPFAVMAIHSGGRLSIWKEGDKEWKSLSHRRNFIYRDVVYHKGKFYARDSVGVTISVELSSESVPVSPVVRRLGDKRLLSYLGDLFLIDWNLDILGGLISKFRV